MHPEIKQKGPGKCPKCGMNLVKEGEMSNHQTDTTNSYRPLVVVISLILVTTVTLSLRDIFNDIFSLSQTISYFMIGFFLVFSGFKLMDLKGFAEGYATYDLLAKKWFGYGFAYPFIEVLFGLSMILYPTVKALLVAEIVVMAFSGLGVAIKLAKHEKFQCACLGTFLKVPLTKVTLIEDFGMAFLAAILLFFA